MMNPIKLRQILDSRRATRAPPLIPPRLRRSEAESATRKGGKEIVDIHLQLKHFRAQKQSLDSTIVCVFSQSEDGRQGPWKMSTASELKSLHVTTTVESTSTGGNNGTGKASLVDKRLADNQKKIMVRFAHIHLPDVFAVEFQLERSDLIKLDICELSSTPDRKSPTSLGYAIFSVSELVVCENGSTLRQLINDESGEVVADAIISCTLRPKPHSILLQFAAKNLVKKNLLSVNSTQIFFEIHRVETASGSSPFTSMLTTSNNSSTSNVTNTTVKHFSSTFTAHRPSNSSQAANGRIPTTKKLNPIVNCCSNSYNNIIGGTNVVSGLNGCWTPLVMSASATMAGGSSNSGVLPPFSLRTTTVLYRSETLKYNSSRIVWRSFTLQSTDIVGRVLELVCMYRDARTSKGLLGRFLMEFEQLKKGPSPENVYFLIYRNSRDQQKACGAFELLRIAQIALPSFLEFVSSGCTLNTAVAIDFSRNAVDEAAVRRYLDDVELVVRAVGEPLRHFNSGVAFPAFGFGARVPPHFRESQEFCLNLDTDPYCQGMDGVLSAFKNAFANIQPLNIAHLSHVIYYVAKLAQNGVGRFHTNTITSTTSAAGGGGFGHGATPIPYANLSAAVTTADQPTYFILIVVTRGVFDDLKETVQAIIFASRAPISVVFIGLDDGADVTSSRETDGREEDLPSATAAVVATMESPAPPSDSVAEHPLQQQPGCGQKASASSLNELERLAAAGRRLNYHGRKPERDCVQYVSLARCRKEESAPSELKALIAERALMNISWQMSSWLTKSGFRPHSTIIADPIIPTATNADTTATPLMTNGTASASKTGVGFTTVVASTSDRNGGGGGGRSSSVTVDSCSSPAAINTVGHQQPFHMSVSTCTNYGYGFYSSDGVGPTSAVERQRDGSVASLRRQSRLVAASVGAQLRQLANRRCRGGIWCRHATAAAAERDDTGNMDDGPNDDDSDGGVCIVALRQRGRRRKSTFANSS